VTTSWRRAAPPGRHPPNASNTVTAGMGARHIQQANTGCNFYFLETSFSAPIVESDIY
jgi:hypothetical protein